MIRLVSRIVVLVVLSLTLTGCLRMLDTAPLLPTPPTGGVAVNPTNSVPETPVPTVAPTLPNVPPTDTPTLEQPTNAPTIAALVPATVAATVASANVQTQQPTLPPPPTNTLAVPTATPVIPTNTAPPPPTIAPSVTPSPIPAASATSAVEPSATGSTGSDATSAAATLTAAAPTPTATNTFAVTIAPPIEGASGTIDAQCNYHIEQNDHLYAIGRRFNRTIQELMKANPSIVNPQLIFMGQTLKIPDCTTR